MEKKKIGKSVRKENCTYSKEQTRVLGERAKNKGRTRKREIHPFAVEFAELR